MINKIVYILVKWSMVQRERRFYWVAALVLMLSMSTLFIIARFIVTPVVVEEAVNKAKLQALLLEKELNIKLSKNVVLTRNIAVLASTLPLNKDTFITNLGELISDSPNIAGGGIWPEPGKLIPDTEKASLFWVKNNKGQYSLDDGYNLPDSSPYHNELWYQSVKSAPRGQCVWSPAYIDPHSNTPMVTCSVRVDREGQFWGVATIDVELTDINQRLAQIEQESGIYSFILDDNEHIVATSPFRDFNLIMKTLEEITNLDPSLAPLLNAIHSKNEYIELETGVIKSEPAILITSELKEQKWRIGIIFPASVAKEKVHLLNYYLSVFVLLLGIIFAVGTVITILISYRNYRLSQKVKSTSKQLLDVSLKDFLTGLPNQTALHIELDHRVELAANSPSSKFAILFIDLDDFKKQNDKFGLSGGDLLLKSVAQRLKSEIKPTDFICRFGGDEFVVLTQNASDKFDVESACAHLLNVMREPYEFEGSSVNLTISIGISCYGDDGETANELLRNASIAKREAKDTARNSFSFSTKKMNERTLRKMVVEEQLLKAIERQELSVAFQPIVDLETGVTPKFEALARWNNKTLGMVAPNEFIEIAEHNGFIIPLGEYLLEQALKTCAHLRKTYGQDYIIAVNVSPKQFNDPMFASNVLHILAKFELPTSSLTLEITEGVLIDNMKKSELVIRQLVESGIKIAMDDFGTGYSSLSYVRHYPFNILKIDKEFIDDLLTDSTSIRLVEAVLAMAKSLGIDVVAEGIEAIEQAEILKAKGCKYGQGYFFSRPLNEKQLESWLLKTQLE